MYTNSIVSSTYCRTGNISSSCLAKSAKANYLKIERKNKKQTFAFACYPIIVYLANSRMNNTMIINCEITQVLIGKSCSPKLFSFCKFKMTVDSTQSF